MKSIHRLARTTLATLLALAGLTAAALSQGGPLTPPPGAPAPTMKSLDLVEPRIPLVDGAPGVIVNPNGSMVIQNPGSYYLTENLTISAVADAISITAAQVSLDLMGYTISHSGGANSLAAIRILNNNVDVRNGHVISTTTFNGTSYTPDGFSHGVFVSGNFLGIRVENLNVRGVRVGGILLGPDSGSKVESCSVHVTAGTGIEAAIVRGSSALLCAGIGINALSVEQGFATSNAQTAIIAWTVSASVAQSTSANSLHHGISATTIRDCVGTSFGGCGIFAAQTVTNSRGTTGGTSSISHGVFGQVVDGCSGQVVNAAGGDGIHAPTLVQNSTGTSAGRHGLYGQRTVINSYGYSNTANADSHGIRSLGSVSNSYGWFDSLAPGDGINALTVHNSHGNSKGRHGIIASVVSGSRGNSTATTVGNPSGISASSVHYSNGTSVTGHGINGTHEVSNSFGVSTMTMFDYAGIRSTGSVQASRGTGWGPGILAHGPNGLVTNSSGNSSNASGIDATHVVGSNGYAAKNGGDGITADFVTHSRGAREDNDGIHAGIRADRAVGCYTINGELISEKFDMP